jgi:hypothetical protein
MIGRTTVHDRHDEGEDERDLGFELVDDLRSFVTISRTHPKDIGQRQVYVRLDEKRTTLLFGDHFTDELDPGLHELRVHNTLMRKRVRFALEPGEHLEFVIINSGRWWTWGFAAVLGSAPLFLKVEKRSRL